MEIRFDDRSARYPVVVDPLLATQQAKLLASDGGTDDAFGASVSISGATVVISALWDDVKGSDSGSAYVFVRSGGVWTEQAKLVASDGASQDKFGYRVSVSGDTAVVGAHGHDDKGPDSGSAYVFLLSRQPVGTACTTDGECESGRCVDGSCCDTACDGLYQACSAALKGSSENGTCGAIEAGTDPQDECTDDGSPSCQQNRLCDGAGACQRYAVQSGCTPQPSSSDQECTSGHCVENVCCDSACTESCKSCVAIKTGDVDGSFKNVLAGGDDPKGVCKASDTDECGADGKCDGQGACRQVAPAGTSCGADTCDGASVMAHACEGSGTCQPSVAKNCTPYLCDQAATDCLTACASTADCVAGAVCNVQTGECAPASPTCKDAYTVQEPDGSETSCVPYRCEAGARLDSCDVPSDCAQGYVCINQVCVPEGDGGSAGNGGAAGAAGTAGVRGAGALGAAGAAPAAPEAESAGDEGGCGCRAVGAERKPVAGAWLAIALAGLVGARRMRRSPRC